jgi:hypothetical protein
MSRPRDLNPGAERHTERRGPLRHSIDFGFRVTVIDIGRFLCT